MSFHGLSSKDSLLHRLDPRARIFVCALFIALTAFASTVQGLAGCLAFALTMLALANIKLSEILPRLLLLNLFIATAGASMPGREGLFALSGGMPDGGWMRLLTLALRCNALLIGATALAGSIDSFAFGHALAHLKVPGKLTHLFLFTASQTATLDKEHMRLRDAMKARAFRPRTDIHSYKSLANLVAMLLVRSLDRASKLSEAMRCRNFKGRFHLLDHFKMRGADWRFATGSTLAIAILLTLELECRSH